MLEFGTNTLEGRAMVCGSKEHLSNKKLLINASFQSLTRLLNKPLHVCYSLSFPGSQ